MKSLTLIAFLSLLAFPALGAEVEINITDVKYEPNSTPSIGGNKGVLTLTGTVKNTGGEQTQFSASLLRFRILERLPDESWKQVPMEQRYRRSGPEGTRDSLSLEPGASHEFELGIDELTRGLPEGKLQIVIWNENGMAAVPFQKKTPDAEN